MAWSRRTGGPWVGLSCALAAACSPPDQVISEILGSRDAKFVAIVSPTHLELRPADAWVWSAPVTDGSTELWLYVTDPGLPLGRHERAGDLLGGLEVPAPDTRLIPKSQDETGELSRGFRLGPPPGATFIRVQGCPMVSVQQVDSFVVRGISKVFDFGDAAALEVRDAFGRKLVVVHPSGVVESTELRQLNANFLDSAGTTLDGRYFIFSDRSLVFVSSTTATPALSDARLVARGTSSFRVMPDLIPEGWVLLDNNRGLYVYGPQRRSISEFTAQGSPFAWGRPLAIDDEGRVFGLLRSSEDYVLVLHGDLVVSYRQSGVEGMGWIDGLGVLATRWTGDPVVLDASGPRAFRLRNSDDVEGPAWLQVYRGGLVAGYADETLAYVDPTGYLCPRFSFGTRRTDVGTRYTLGACKGPDCRWRGVIAASETGEVYFITPVE